MYVRTYECVCMYVCTGLSDTLRVQSGNSSANPVRTNTVSQC